MKIDAIPVYQGEPILDGKARPAFRVSPEEIIHSIRQQFPHKELALRELGQNSQDADAAAIRVDYRFEDQHMMMEFLDDGCGMTREILIKHYLCLFDSSKEGQKDKVGMWSLGRLSLLCYDPERIEVITLPINGPGYRLVIEKDLSGEFYELDRETAKSSIQGEHGTLVRMIIPMDSSKTFVDEVEKANRCMERELGWIRPAITATTAQIKDQRLEYGSKMMNRAMTVPGRYSTAFVIHMASGSGKVQCAIGLQSKEETGLSPITLCSGAIPIERPPGLPWTGKDDFALRGMHLILDSFDFETNIGRNVVYRDTAFMKEFLKKFFEKVLLGRFIPTMAGLCSQPAFRAYEVEDSLRLLLADMCIKSQEFGFPIPEEVLHAPFLQSFVSFRPYCLSDLDRVEGPIYFTSEKPDILSMRERDGETSDVVCLCISDLPWEFREFLQHRYEGRLKEKEHIAVVVDEDSPEFQELSERIRKRLGRVRLWSDQFYNWFDPVSRALEVCSDLRVARLVRYDGRDETHFTTLFSRSPARIYLNHNNAHVRNLIELLFQTDGPYEDLAVHFLMREVLFDPGFTFSISQREQLLTRDLEHRFRSRSLSLRKSEADEADSRVHDLFSNLFSKDILEI